MATENEGGGNSAGAVFGRAGAPKIPMPQRGVAIGFCWSGDEGAGNQILAAKVELSRERARLVEVMRPFQDRGGRRDVVERFPSWLAEELRWAEGKLVVGIDSAFSLSETHLRQLGLLRQGLRGPVALGRGLEERFLPPGVDFNEAAEAFKLQLGKDRNRVSDCYRATSYAPSHARTYKQTFFTLATLAHLDDACFPPWDPPQPTKAALVEVHPPHVARALAGACFYRDDPRDGVNRASARAALLRTLRAAARLEFEMEEAAQIVEDAEGDALDAVLAAIGAAAAQEDGFQGVPANVPRSEGWIYSIREEPWRAA
jgi:hypothetical protein